MSHGYAANITCNLTTLTGRSLGNVLQSVSKFIFVNIRNIFSYCKWSSKMHKDMLKPYEEIDILVVLP